MDENIEKIANAVEKKIDALSITKGISYEAAKSILAIEAMEELARCGSISAQYSGHLIVAFRAKDSDDESKYGMGYATRDIAKTILQIIEEELQKKEKE